MGSGHGCWCFTIRRVMARIAMTITRIDPPLYFETPLGPSVCHFVWEAGVEVDVQWCCFIEKTGEPWWWPNNKIRLQTNITSGRYSTSEIKETPEMTLALTPHRNQSSGRQ